MFDESPSDASVVLRYYLYRAVGNPGFIWPVYVLYLLDSGIGYAAIGTIGAVQSVLTIAAEVPTGYVGDRIGRRNSLLVAQVLYAASGAGMILGDGFLGYLAAFGLLSVARTFVSGRADGWLYDTLAERLDESRFTHVKGRGAAVGQWVMAVTMVGGGLLYAVEPVYPFVAALAMWVLTFVVVLTLPQTAAYADADGSDADGESEDGEDFTVLSALPVVRERLAAPELRPFVAYMALFSGVAVTVGIYVQPLAVETLERNAGGVLSSLGVQEAASLGVLYAAFTVVGAVASDRASDLEAAFGVRRTLLAIPLLTAVLFVLPVVAPLLVFPMFFAMRGAQSVVRPIAGQYLNDRLASVGRATVLSVVSMLYSLARIPFILGSGVLADHTSALVAVAALGVAFLAVGGTLAVLRPPVARGATTGGTESATPD